jgi:hypothetical protein
MSEPAAIQAVDQRLADCEVGPSPIPARWGTNLGTKRAPLAEMAWNMT